MICQVTSLTCGYNGGGHAALVSFERDVSLVAQDRTVFSRCLVNVGDGTQRFCNENRIKLSTISCIIVTSLAPHNIAGFPGLFLSLSDLGVGAVSVIGPSGIKSSIDLMLPFTNRKYPALDILEVDHNTPSEDLTVHTQNMTIHVQPVYASEANTKVMAVAASIHYRSSSLPNPLLTGNQNFNSMASVFPLPFYFESFPSLKNLVGKAVEYGHRTCKTATENVFLFVPLAVASFDTDEAHQLNDNRSTVTHFSRVRHLCLAHGASGILSTGNLSDAQFEFAHSQSMLSVLNSLCPPVFPEVARKLRQEAGAAAIDTVLRFSAPMLSVTCGESKLISIVDQSYLSKSVDRIKQRNAAMTEIYKTLVLPRLRQVLAPEQASSRPPPPPHPPVIMRAHSAHSEGFVPFHPSGPPPPPPPPPRPLVLATSSSLNILTDLSSLSEPHDASTDTFSSLVSEDHSDLGTPSPQSNFTAASMLRANLLTKRKLSNRTPVTDFQSTHMGIGFEQEQEQERSRVEGIAAVGSGNGLPHLSPEFDEVISTTPLKSLRLNDSSKHFTFPSGDSPQLRPLPPPPPSAEGSENLSLETNNNNNNNNNTNNSSTNAAVCSEAARVADVAYANSVFSVPPPNPFGDICTVTFLGTGSATPSKYRNGSCIMLALNTTEQHGHAGPFSDSVPAVPVNKQIILLDCGEGTATQMFQSVASDLKRFDELLLNIKLIWISHHHADHITGVPMLLEQIKRAQMRRDAAKVAAAHETSGHHPAALHSNNFRSSMRLVPAMSKYDMRSMFSSGGYEAGKVMIIGSEAVLKYFEFSACVAGLDDLVTFTPIVSTLYAGATCEISAATGGVITRLRSIPVQHCHSSYGLVLDFKSNHKIVYSGDCRPSQSLVKAGIDCDLLIHEATFDDTKQDDAVKKRHSTSSEARRLAVQMRAKHTVLTHFSQRYPLEASNALHALSDLPTSHQNSHGTQGARGASVSYDFLKFSFPSQAQALPMVTAALGSVLSAIEEERKKLRQAAGAHHLA